MLDSATYLPAPGSVGVLGLGLDQNPQLDELSIPMGVIRSVISEAQLCRAVS